MTTQPVPAPQSRLRGLDGLRFIAAAAVVGYHFTGTAIPYWGVIPAVKFPTLNVVTRYGFIGVELFFMISGFVILMTAYGRPIEDFVASRFSRLFPAYWVAVLLTIVLQIFWRQGRSMPPVDSMVNLTMMQEAFNVTDIQGAFWTLWIELKFYVLIGVFVLVGITRKRVVAFALIWPILGQLASATHQGLLNSLLVPTYAPYFSLGMLLFLIYRDRGDIAAWLGVGLNLVWCIQHMTHYAPHVSKLVHARISPLVLTIVLILMVVGIWAVSSGPLANLNWRWLTIGGALTYPLYLIHGQFGFLVIDVTHKVLPTYVVLFLAVVVAIALAALLHYAVEEPLHMRLRAAVRTALEKVGASSTRRAAHAAQPADPSDAVAAAPESGLRES